MEKLNLRQRYGHLFSSPSLAEIIDEQDPQAIPAFEAGGHVMGHGADPSDGKKGGYFHGRKHSQGGIKAINVTTGQPIEVEGGEVIITAPAVDDNTKRKFNGKMMTNREILSEINQSGGGVKFEEGGEISELRCGGSMYEFGGETMEDFNVVRRLQNEYELRTVSPAYRKFLNTFKK